VAPSARKNDCRLGWLAAARLVRLVQPEYGWVSNAYKGEHFALCEVARDDMIPLTIQSCLCFLKNHWHVSSFYDPAKMRFSTIAALVGALSAGTGVVRRCPAKPGYFFADYVNSWHRTPRTRRLSFMRCRAIPSSLSSSRKSCPSPTAAVRPLAKSFAPHHR
jgi:hypothetical protein